LSTPPDDISPNSKALWNTLSCIPGAALKSFTDILSPHHNYSHHVHPRKFGLLLESDPMSRRNMIFDVVQHSSASKVDWEYDLRFRTIIQIYETPVFLVAYVTHCLANVDVATQDAVSLIVAAYQPNQINQVYPLLQFVLDQMRAIHHVLHGWDLDDPFLCVSPAIDPILLITNKNAGNRASYQRHTHCICLQDPHRAAWINSEFAPLDIHNSYGMYGTTLPHSAVPHSATVVHPILQYSQNGDNIFKARKFMNGN
jgi:hypothetical protein